MVMSNTHTFDSIMDTINLINILITFILVLLGLFINTISLLIIYYSNKKRPKLAGSIYLTLMSLINILYILIHFYVCTFDRIIYALNLYKSKNFLYNIYLYDRNRIACKTLIYLKYVFRVLNLNLTLSFSIERTLAIYNPIKVKTIPSRRKLYIFLSIIAAFIKPSYLLYFSDVIPIEDKNPNSSDYLSNFNIMSSRPTFDKTYCSSYNLKYVYEFNIVYHCSIVIIYLILSFSVIPVIYKIKKSKNKFNDLTLIQKSYKEARSNSERSTKNRKVYNIKHLIYMSMSYVLFDLPYIVIIILYFVILKDKIDLDENFSYRFKVKSFLMFVEILQLAYFCLSGFLFFWNFKRFKGYNSFRKSSS
ncbi:unnamed protein product [Brachionus calyciflorus]|uniref:G-protein coupled receptors family 1 profile domain-containing protein n=1 Tax=Brachionus calyciflorus TaxID=104777 RepID=A0A813RC42_9BILA|nr:unnamed protein product [Brachionus calyciflorus]